MEEDIELYVNDQSGCYIESLSRCRQHLSPFLLGKLDAVLEKELELAIIAVNKALREVTRVDNVRPIK